MQIQGLRVGPDADSGAGVDLLLNSGAGAESLLNSRAGADLLLNSGAEQTHY